MKFHDDISEAYKPLEDFLSTYCDLETVEKKTDEFLYLGYDEEKTYYGRKGWNTSFFNVFHNGKVEAGDYEDD